MPTAREGFAGAAGVAVGVAASLLLPGERAIEHRTVGVVVDRMETVGDVPDSGLGPSLALTFDRVDGDGFVVDRPTYSPQYVSDALAACDRAEAAAGGGYVAPKRARWAALRDAFAARGVLLPAPSAPP